MPPVSLARSVLKPCVFKPCTTNYDAPRLTTTTKRWSYIISTGVYVTPLFSQNLYVTSIYVTPKKVYLTFFMSPGGKGTVFLLFPRRSLTFTIFCQIRVSEWKCCFFFSGAIFFFRLLRLSEWVTCKLFLGKKKHYFFGIGWEKKTPPKWEKLQKTV